MPERKKGIRLSVVVLLVFFVVVVGKVAVFSCVVFVVFFVLFILIVVVIFGNEVEMNGMGLGDFELGFTFRAAEDLALLDFVFVHVDFGGTFGTADHGSILRKVVQKVGAAEPASTTVQRIIYRWC
jgi:energy-coupling factor transporter transmembrane protein EcfT